MGVDGIFGVGDDILAGLNDDDSILVFQFGFFDLVVNTTQALGRTIES